MRALLLSTAVLTAALPAGAVRVVGGSTALLGLREVARGDEAVADTPLGIVLALDAGDLGLPMVADSHAVVQAWARAQLSSDPLAPNDAELGLAYLEGDKGPLRLRLGRQHLVTGLGRMLTLDGAFGRLALPWGIALEAFGGTTVRPEQPITTAAWTAGGRVTKRLPGVGEAAVAFRHEAGSWGTRRQDLGLDAFYLVGPVRLTGLASLSLPDRQFAEGRLLAEATLLPGLSVGLDAERVRPSLLLPRTSIFAVFSETSHDRLGATAAFRPSPYWDFSVGGGAVILDNAYGGYELMGRAVTYREPSHRSLIGLELQRVRDVERCYVRGRVMTTLGLTDWLRVAGDLYAYYYNPEINAAGRAFLAQLSGIVDILTNSRLVASAAAGSTAHARFSIEGQLRFVWDFDPVAPAGGAS